MGNQQQELKQQWADLLAATDTTPEMSPAFPKILKSLSPQDAKFLAWLYEQDPTGESAPGIPGFSSVSNAMKQLNLDINSLYFTLVNLSRNLLVFTTLKDSSSSGPVGTPLSGVVDPVDLATRGALIGVTISVYGMELVRACRPTPAN